MHNVSDINSEFYNQETHAFLDCKKMLLSTGLNLIH